MEKFLIQSPREKENILLTFPFFIQLKEKFPDAQINVIVNKGLEEHFELLPFKVNIYPLPERLDSLTGIHKFAVNVTDVFNIDYFFDLARDPKGAFTGMSFRSKIRVGEDKGLKKFLYTKKIEYSEIEVPFDELTVKYLNSILETDLPDFFYSAPEIEKLDDNVVKLFDEGDSSFFLLKNNDLSFEVWKELLLLMESGRVVIWDMKNLDQWREFKADPKLKVELIIQGEVAGLSFLRELLPKCTYVLTDDDFLAHVSYFYQKRSFLFSPSDLKRVNSKFFSNVEDMIHMEDGDVVEIYKFGEKKDIKVMDEVLDFIHDVMKL
ncbi:hypothetical protein A9Q84_05885 [Halobacteriovorax marinus]|uniref:Uncharacterized protein n=1 Tax=Halobacteriovorax marinus TaxID=97084 RepID=A0A1Y5FBF7_9BACT|nr:hypothetical protein A9Q84_05885 [Halobacteriovorax marinus]